MDNFDLRKYLAEGKLNEDSSQGDMYGLGPAYQALDSGIQYYIDEFIKDINADIEEGADKASVTEYLNDLIKAIAALRDSVTFPPDLAEGRLFEEDKPVWTIEGWDDSPTIESADEGYVEAVVNYIKSTHPNISDKDLKKSMEVAEETWYNEGRENAKSGEGEDFDVSVEEFADGAIEYYEDALMLAEGRLYEYVLGSRHGTLFMKFKDLEAEIEKIASEGDFAVRRKSNPSDKVQHEWEIVPIEDVSSGEEKSGIRIYDYKFEFDPAKDKTDEPHSFSVGGVDKVNTLSILKDLFGAEARAIGGTNINDIDPNAWITSPLK